MFTIEKWQILEQQNTVRFYYVCEKYGSFSEDIVFPSHVSIQSKESDYILNNLLDIAATYIAISYYKLAASGHIQLRIPVADEAKASLKKLYIEGLGEFYIRNELDYPPNISIGFLSQPQTKPKVSTPAFEERAILAFGGGKDSHVSRHILDDMELPYELVSVVLSSSVQQTLKNLAGRDMTFIERKIDPRLIELGKKGEGYNGHIPITAINSIILSIYAYLNKTPLVIFSNERGASQPTMMHERYPINHQYSKSFEFEEIFSNMLEFISSGELMYFSLLRPFSELWIAKYLALYIPQIHDVFSSCNRNFVFEGKGKLSAGERWCGACSKCLYTALIMAPHLSKKDFHHVFGHDLLNDISHVEIVKNLCGIGEDKPWECVGDVFDTASALHHLTTLAEWKNDAIVIALLPELVQKYGEAALSQRFVSQFSASEEHLLPESFRLLLNTVI